MPLASTNRNKKVIALCYQKGEFAVYIIELYVGLQLDEVKIKKLENNTIFL